MVKVVERITQKRVAEWLGIHEMHYSLFIRDKAGVSIKRLQHFTRLTGVSAEQILSLRGDKSHMLHLLFRDAYRKRETTKDPALN